MNQYKILLISIILILIFCQIFIVNYIFKDKNIKFTTTEEENIKLIGRPKQNGYVEFNKPIKCFNFSKDDLNKIGKIKVLKSKEAWGEVSVNFWKINKSLNCKINNELELIIENLGGLYNDVYYETGNDEEWFVENFKTEPFEGDFIIFKTTNNTKKKVFIRKVRKIFEGIKNLNTLEISTDPTNRFLKIKAEGLVPGGTGGGGWGSYYLYIDLETNKIIAKTVPIKALNSLSYLILETKEDNNRKSYFNSFSKKFYITFKTKYELEENKKLMHLSVDGLSIKPASKEGEYPPVYLQSSNFEDLSLKISKDISEYEKFEPEINIKDSYVKCIQEKEEVYCKNLEIIFIDKYPFIFTGDIKFTYDFKGLSIKIAKSKIDKEGSFEITESKYYEIPYEILEKLKLLK